MKPKNQKRRRSGAFTVGPEKTIYGELKINGEATSLYLHDKDYFPTHEFPNRCIKGVLHDITHVTLIDCVAPRVPSSVSKGDDGYHYAKVFPHYVVQGERHLDPDATIIDEISFLVDDATTLFNDFDAFGSLIFDAQPFVEQIVKVHVPDRAVATGEDARLIYFTGKSDICSVDTVYGKVSVERNPGFNFGGSGGAYIQNKILISIRFHIALAFHEAISRASILIEYLGLLVGRPQNLVALGVRIEIESDKPIALDVHWSRAPKRDKSIASKKPSSLDVLIDAVQSPHTIC